MRANHREQPQRLPLSKLGAVADHPPTGAPRIVPPVQTTPTLKADHRPTLAIFNVVILILRTNRRKTVLIAIAQVVVDHRPTVVISNAQFVMIWVTGLAFEVQVLRAKHRRKP